MRDIEKEIAETEEKLLKLKLAYAQSQQPLFKIATDLHELLCHTDHVEGCRWAYESEGFANSTPNSVHVRYLRLAERLTQEIGTDVAVRAVKVLLAGR